MKNLVSIIVPVFNTEKYIRRCVESLLNQDYKNIEILLIDDGSGDKSGEICEEYSKNFSFVKTFHKTNGGASSARNIGLSQIKGEFFCFVDSDDFVDSDYVGAMIKTAREKSCDIVCTPRIKSSKTGVFERDFVIRDFIYDLACHYNFYSCLKLFKTSLLGKIKFDTRIKVGEDFDFTSQMLLKSRKIGLLSKPTYHYFYSDTSIMRSNFSEKFDSQRISYENFIKRCKKDYPQFLNDAYYYAVLVLFGLYYRSRGVRGFEKLNENYVKEISKFAPFIYKNPLVRLKFKAVVFAFSNFFWLIKRLKK